jgi:hypothetical protein
MAVAVVVSSRAAAVLTTGPIALGVGCADGQIAPRSGVLPRVSHPELELRAIDLFAGAGGATQRLRDAGYHVVAAIDNDVAAARTYRLHGLRLRD